MPAAGCSSITEEAGITGNTKMDTDGKDVNGFSLPGSYASGQLKSRPEEQ